MAKMGVGAALDSMVVEPVLDSRLVTLAVCRLVAWPLGAALQGGVMGPAVDSGLVALPRALHWEAGCVGGGGRIRQQRRWW